MLEFVTGTGYQGEKTVETAVITAPMTRGGVIHNWAVAENGLPYVLCGTRKRTGVGCSQKGRPVFPIDQHEATCAKCVKEAK